MQDRIAITGASGFIGGALLRFIEESGRFPHVRALASDAGSEARLRARFPQADVIRYRNGSEVIDEDALSDCAVLVHCGWSSLPGTADRDPQEDVATNVENSIRLFRAAAMRGVRRVVFLSSGGTIYGDSSISPIPESSLPKPEGAYGAAKLCAELYLRVIAEHHGLDYCILRPGNVYGRIDRVARPQGVIEQWMIRASQGDVIDVWGATDTVRDFVHISDMVLALERAILCPVERGVFNVGTGVGTSLAEVLERLRVLAGSSLRIDHHVASTTAVRSNILDTRSAEDILGFRARVPLNEGMAMTWNSLAP